MRLLFDAVVWRFVKYVTEQLFDEKDQSDRLVQIYNWLLINRFDPTPPKIHAVKVDLYQQNTAFRVSQFHNPF